MTAQNRKHARNDGQYATAADFKQIFTEDINSLYLLSLLLTGSPEKAEKCFVEFIAPCQSLTATAPVVPYRENVSMIASAIASAYSSSTKWPPSK